MPFGLTATGFVRKTIEDVKGEIEAAEKSQIDSRLNVEPESPIGQLNGILASKISEVWELAEAVNAGRFPYSASGFQLGQVASITGTTRGGATKGAVSLTLGLSGAGVITVPAGSIVQVLGDTGNRWVTLAEVSGVAGSYPVEAEAETAGPYIANPGTITVIVTPISGWASVTNAAAATAGQDIDTDPELRARRERELTLAGASTLEAIRADVRAVDAVESATIFQNVTDVVDGDGIPPHAIEAVVVGGVDADVAAAIFGSVAAGIAMHGTTSVNHIDSQGFTRVVEFTRPTEIRILVEIDLLIDVRTYPAGGDALVIAALSDFVNALPVGNDVFLSQLYAPAIAAADGIISVTAIRIGSASPVVAAVASDYTIGARELATHLASDLFIVATTPGTP